MSAVVVVGAGVLEGDLAGRARRWYTENEPLERQI
jgi:hypothetical protein